MIAQVISSLTLAFGAWMGLFAMLKPDWISRTVGLTPTEGHAEGASEFRGTLGGLFFFSHLTTLVLLWYLDQMIAPIIVIPLAAAWAGSGIGRMLSIWRDEGTNTRQNWIWVGFELGFSALIILPFIMMLLLIHITG